MVWGEWQSGFSKVGAVCRAVACRRFLVLCALIPLRAGAETARPVSSEIIDKYTNVLPDALLDIWRREGFRAYPGHGITLTNPDIWEATLTRWLHEADASSLSRTIAISPLGGLFVYRR